MDSSVKTVVKNAYSAIAKGNSTNSCCGNTACCSSGEEHSMAIDYGKIEGHFEEADLSLGCGIPTETAKISKGDTVVDLGSGAGNDAFVARSIVGESGRVIGVDMTAEMVILAMRNNQKLNFKNVDFVLNDIENMTDIPDNIADVVISNCVLNLVPDKKKVFKEIHRITKTGGHFSISDIVFSEYLPDKILEAAELYAGCVSGAIKKEKYLGHVKASGFKNIQIKNERKIDLPDDLLLKYISETELAEFKKSGSGIYSITVFAEKTTEGSCCESSTSTCCGTEKAVEEERGCCEAGGSSDCC